MAATEVLGPKAGCHLDGTRAPHKPDPAMAPMSSASKVYPKPSPFPPRLCRTSKGGVHPLLLCSLRSCLAGSTPKTFAE